MSATGSFGRPRRCPKLNRGEASRDEWSGSTPVWNLHCQAAPPESFAFSFPVEGRLTTLTHRAFVAQFKAHLPYLGYDPSQYAGHSFRRGGATFAFQCGAPPAQIKEQGDWKSSAYLLYLEFDDTARAQVAGLMARAIFSSPTWRSSDQPP